MLPTINKGSDFLSSRNQDCSCDDCCEKGVIRFPHISSYLDVPEPPSTELPGFPFLYDTGQKSLQPNDAVTFGANGIIQPTVVVTHEERTGSISFTQTETTRFIMRSR